MILLIIDRIVHSRGETKVKILRIQIVKIKEERRVETVFATSVNSNRKINCYPHSYGSVSKSSCDDLHWKTESHAARLFSWCKGSLPASFQAPCFCAVKSLYEPEKFGSQFRILPAIVTSKGKLFAICSLRSVAVNKRCLACLLTMKSVQPSPEAGHNGTRETFFASDTRSACESAHTEARNCRGHKYSSLTISRSGCFQRNE